MLSERTQAILLCAAAVATIVGGFWLYNWERGQAEIERQLWLQTVKGSPVATATCQRDLAAWDAGDKEGVLRRYALRAEGIIEHCRSLVEQAERRK